MGISKFANPSLNLKYAASDARAFFGTLRSSLGKELAEGRAIILNDTAAKREVVAGELAKIANRVSPQDMLIIFIATHGLPDPDTNEIAFLMHDTDPNNLLGTGLTQSDLESILRRSPAGKVLIVLDACHSGGLGTADLIGRRGSEPAEVNRMLALLAKTTDGTAILSASSAAEMSLEGEQWKGGAFTHFLLNGLRGAADTNRDQTITLRELYDFVYDKVSDATNGEQHPELKGHFSNELPLAIVNP